MWWKLHLRCLQRRDMNSTWLFNLFNIVLLCITHRIIENVFCSRILYFRGSSIIWALKTCVLEEPTHNRGPPAKLEDLIEDSLNCEQNYRFDACKADIWDPNDISTYLTCYYCVLCTESLKTHSCLWSSILEGPLLYEWRRLEDPAHNRGPLSTVK